MSPQRAIKNLRGQIHRTICDLEDFLDPEGEYQWTREAGQSIVADLRKVLEQTKQRSLSQLKEIEG